MPNETLAYDLIKNSFIHTNIAGAEWIIPLIMIVVSLFIITRDIEEWKTLGFLVSVTLYTAGLRVHILILVGTGIIFAINSLSLTMIGNTIGAVSRSITVIGEKILKEGKIAYKTKKAITPTKPRTTSILAGMKPKDAAKLIMDTRKKVAEQSRPLTKQEKFMKPLQQYQKEKEALSKKIQEQARETRLHNIARDLAIRQGITLTEAIEYLKKKRK